MPQHIGIVACSAEGAALCYRTICLEGVDLLGRYAHPEITMHTHPLSEYMRFIEAGDWNGVATLMISSTEKVARAGADFAICPDNTIHQAFSQVVAKSTIPWLHIAGEVATEAKRKNHRRLGVLGTRYLMEGPVYSEKLAEMYLDHRIPDAGERERINEIIFTQLVNGRFTDESRSYFRQVIQNLKDRGCDAVVLGCTEIPLLVTADVSPLPTLDSTRLLARAALRRAAAG
ncbi:aspartate/glutamate racemase family protein [Candidatus Zixiibacteriota bacterium]